MSIVEKKAELREEARLRLTSMSPVIVAAASDQICKKLMKYLDSVQPKRVLLYCPRPESCEVILDGLTDYLKVRGSIFDYVLPKKGASFPDGTYDVIIVPLLGFDGENYRLGNGGGWYDRFLHRQPQAVKIGLGFKLARFAVIPHEKHDIAMDIVLTED